MPPVGYETRLVLDEDVPELIAVGLRDRGITVLTTNELRERILSRRGTDPGEQSIQDDEVCQEVASEPSVLVSLNLRDYADLASMQALAIRHGVSVVAVRVPKADAGRGERPAAIADIVHRHLPRILRLSGGEPKIGSANRGSLRVRSAPEILAKAPPEAVEAIPRIHRSGKSKRGKSNSQSPAANANKLDVDPG